MSTLPSTRVYEGTRIPSPVPTILEVDPEKHRLEDILRVNFGPNHPSTHGVLRLVVDLDGETVAGIRAVIGYLHTGFEKNMEHKSWWKSVTYAPRMDYVAFHANELLYVLAIEKLLGIEVPPRAVWARMAMAELNRIHSHLVWLGTSALELGAISLFEQPGPSSALGLPTDLESPREGLDEVALERSGVGQRRLSQRRSHSVDERRDERRAARPAPIDRGLVDRGPRRDHVHSKAVVARVRELDDRGIEHATHHLLAASPEGPLGATR